MNYCSLSALECIPGHRLNADRFFSFHNFAKKVFARNTDRAKSYIYLQNFFWPCFITAMFFFNAPHGQSKVKLKAASLLM